LIENETNERPTLNVERPTSNIESAKIIKYRTIHDMCVARAKSPFEILSAGKFEILRFAFFNKDKAQRHQYWTFDVGRSMFDVQSVRGSDNEKFHVRVQKPKLVFY
jgi:hypothetical protein